MLPRVTSLDEQASIIAIGTASAPNKEKRMMTFGPQCRTSW
jgi:hypothetical protein